MKASPGDTLRVGVVRGPRGQATVRRVGDEVQVTVVLEDAAEGRPVVDLVLALPRPKALSRVLSIVASMGVGRIDLVNAWRVEKSYFDSPRLGDEETHEALLLGCEQGGTTWVPEFQIHPRLMPFLDDVLPSLPVAAGLLAHPGARCSIEEVAPAEATRVVIGPEGGFIPREVDTFVARGFEPVRISRRVLRVEAAVPVVLAQLELLERLRASPLASLQEGR